MKNERVAVVGAAVGGAATALSLARLGANVTVFERVERPRAVGAGIALAPNGLGVLYGLGLESELRRCGSLLETPRVVDAEGRTLLQPQLPSRLGELGRTLMVRRSDLQFVLMSALARHEVEVRLKSQVIGATPDGTLTFADGSSDTFDLVVGADGVHSVVRETGGFTARVTETGIRYVRGLSDSPLALNEEAWTAAGIFGSFPVPGGTYWFCSSSHPDVERALEARDLDALRRVWALYYPRALRVLERQERFVDLLVNEVVRVDCERYFQGRLVLVGDAAHAMAPNLGQGANSALVDAAVLFEELSRGDTQAEALGRYDERRRPRVRRVQEMAAEVARLSERTGPTFRWVRDRLLSPLGKLGGGRRMQRVLQEDPLALRGMLSA